MSKHDVFSGLPHRILFFISSLLTAATLQSIDASAAAAFDILWRNASTGQDSIWVLNGTPLAISAFLQPNIPGPWQIVGSGDFDGDGKPDILRRNASTGHNSVWLMDCAPTVTRAYIAHDAHPTRTVER